MSAPRDSIADPDESLLDRPLIEVLKPPSKNPKLFGLMEKAFDIRTVGDLLAHLPRRLQDRGEVTDLGSLVEGELVTIVANVERVSTRQMKARRGSITEVVIGDGRRHLTLTWFSAAWVGHALRPGQRAMFAGKVSLYKDKPQLTYPTFTVLPDDVEIAADGTVDLGDVSGRMGAQLARPLMPIYPATRQVDSWAILGVVHDALRLAAVQGLPDPLPDELLDRFGFVGYLEALQGLHQPVTRDQWSRARARLAFDEALEIQLVLARRRHAARAVPATARPVTAGGLVDALDARLPFTLTAGQQEIGAVVARELADRVPMQRLLQGEVGSGKTVVALRAMLQVVDSGGQAVLLAPTEVLAQQHARSLTAMLGPLAERGRLGGSEQSTRVALVTGSLGARARRAALLELASGEAGIAVGTHALLEDRVQFADLGLVVVDEQHRFGVEQRDALRGRSGRTPPHVLVMTATPIPRTVAMTVFGDLEVSVLRERPAGRAAVSTAVVPVQNAAWFTRVWQRVREEVGQGRQAFVVFPRVGGDEVDDEFDPPTDVEDEPLDLDDLEPTPPERRPAAAVLELGAELAGDELAGLRTAQLFGRMPADDKDAVMTAFAAGELDVLLATTVIEVGVDVPNASVMVILDADRFGVSQLHQLRGRIGRGGHPGVCLLVTSAPEGSPARLRLDAVAGSDDGFVLAEADLEARREGDVLGAAQSGRKRSLRLLSLLRDRDVIASARDVASQVVDADPYLGKNPRLRRRVEALESQERSEFLAKS